MTPFTTLRAVAVPLEESDIDTGVIFPSRFLRRPRGSGYQDALFHDRRFDPQGRERPDCVFNLPPYRGARILVCGANFGCGSSRESAVHALQDAGFRCVVAPSFGDIFLVNCFRNGLLPALLPEAEVKALQARLRDCPGLQIEIDLAVQTILSPGGHVWQFRIDPARKRRLQAGLDDCALALRALDEIRRFEHGYLEKVPWIR